MRKRMVCLFLSGIVAMGLLTGCGDKTTASESDAIYGEVSSIEGSEIVLKLGEMSTPEKPTGEAPGGDKPEDNGEAPSGNKPEESGGTSTIPLTVTGGTTTDAKEPDAGQAPDGAGGGQMMGGLTLTDEEKTIRVTEDTTIKMETQPEMSADGAHPGMAEDKNTTGDDSIDKDSTDKDNTDKDSTDKDSTDKDSANRDERPQEKPEAQTEEATIDDITEGSILKVTMDGDRVSEITIMAAGMGGGDLSGSSTGDIALTGIYTVDATEETSDGETIDSTAADQNTVLVTNKGTLTMDKATLTKTGNTSDNDESNFYGVNGVFTVAAGSTASLSNTRITSAAEGSNGIFATGEGSSVTANSVQIQTTGNSSRGLDATYGGTIQATNVTIDTKGAHCAPIATDRGEGAITVDGATLSAAGDGSPCIYSTGDISVKNATGTATGSQAMVVEGKNTITLENSDLTGAGENGVMLYQSTSGDAAEGTAKLNVKDSRLTTTSKGAMFYVTNTDAEATLENTTLTFPSGILVEAAGNNTNNWGTPGSNGGTFTLNGTKQTFKGDITCDDSSTVILNLSNGSTYEGRIDTAQEGKASISLDKDSKWTVTGDSYVDSLTDKDETCGNILANGHTIYYNANNDDNAWLNGATLTTTDGGKITPAK